MLGVGNQQELSNDLECDSFLNTALQRLTCDLYYRFGAYLAPVSVVIITDKHYAVRKINVCEIEVHYVGKIGLAFQQYFGPVRKAQFVSREFVSRALNN